MLKLTRQNFNKIKSILLRQKKEVEKEIKSIAEEDTVMVDDTSSSNEPGTESWLADVHTRAVSASTNLSKLLSRISKSLHALNSGKYGKCEKCGKDIEEKRLLALPTATMCIACSKKYPVR